MFVNLRDYFVKNQTHKLEELRNDDLDLWEQLDDSDIIDLAFNRAQKLEILCIVLLCLSAFLIAFGFLTYFHIINIENLVRLLQSVAL